MSLRKYSFLANISSWQRTCYFWQFEDIIIHSAKDAASKIAALECGKISYPWDRMADVASLSGEYYIDGIDRCLPPA